MLTIRFFMTSLVPFLVLCSCIISNEAPLESSSNAASLIQTGNIIVASTGNDSIVLLNSDGTYKATLLDEPTSTNISFGGLAYDTALDQVLFNYDHATATLDAVKSFSLYDGAISTVISNSNLAGTMPGLARLTGGELLVLEGTNTVEKFLSTGARSGAPFLAGLTTNLANIHALSTGGFVTCSSATTNTVRTYDAAGTEVSSATSASPVPSLGALASTGCIEDSSGQIIVAYSGGTDAVRVYNSSLSAVIWTFTDTTVLGSPGKLALRANGNILVTDMVFNHIVEISPSGVLVDVIGGTVLATPNSILVVP